MDSNALSGVCSVTKRRRSKSRPIITAKEKQKKLERTLLGKREETDGANKSKLTSEDCEIEQASGF